MSCSILLVPRKLFIPRLLTCRIKLNVNNFHFLNKTDSGIVSRLQQKLPVVSKRNFFWIFKKRSARDIRGVDNPPKHYELIYRCSFDHTFLCYQHLAFYAATILCLLIAYRSGRYDEPFSKKINNDTKETKPEKFRLEESEYELPLLLGAFTFLFTITHFVISKTPMRIYCYPQKKRYLLCFYGIVPNQIRKLPLSVGQLECIPEKSLIPWMKDTFIVKETGQTLYILEDYFRRPADLFIMMGWQNDPDVNYDYEDQDENMSKEEQMKDTKLIEKKK